MSNTTYLPKRPNWFRLPDYVRQLIGAGTVADISVADATDLPTAIALANANKAKINELLAVLRTAGLLEA